MKLLTDCAGMTKREIDEYLVELRPKPVFNPSIRKQLSLESDKTRSEGQHETARASEEVMLPCPAPSVQELPSNRPSPNLLEPVRPDVFNFRFSADGDFKKKFERLAEVLGVENPLKNMAEILEQAVDISLEKKDPKRKLERRLERKRKETASIEKSRPDEISADEKAKSRYIPSEVRERVYQRAGFHCTFRGFDGTRCSSRTGLEIEHQRPFAIYQSHDERFLRVLCRRHNEFEAERVYGADFIRGKIDEKKRRKVTRGGTQQLPPSALRPNLPRAS